MAGDATKIKLGAAWVTFGTVAGNIGQVLDLGYTKGGVGFTVETQSREITVDQEGLTPVAESLLGRRVSLNCPMAQSDYEILHYLTPDSAYAPDTWGNLLKVASGLGDNLMDYADEVVVTSKFDVQDWIKLYFAAPIASFNATFTADGERIWPIQFKAFVVPVGEAEAGYICGIHEAS